MLPTIEQRLALELAAKPVQVAAAIELLDEGATVPFIARYRKEATGGLDDIQLRLLEERLRYLRELEERRAAIVASISNLRQLSNAAALVWQTLLWFAITAFIAVLIGIAITVYGYVVSSGG